MFPFINSLMARNPGLRSDGQKTLWVEHGQALYVVLQGRVRCSLQRTYPGKSTTCRSPLSLLLTYDPVGADSAWPSSTGVLDGCIPRVGWIYIACESCYQTVPRSTSTKWAHRRVSSLFNRSRTFWALPAVSYPNGLPLFSSIRFTTPQLRNRSFRNSKGMPRDLYCPSHRSRAAATEPSPRTVPPAN